MFKCNQLSTIYIDISRLIIFYLILTEYPSNIVSTNISYLFKTPGFLSATTFQNYPVNSNENSQVSKIYLNKFYSITFCVKYFIHKGVLTCFQLKL